MIEAIQTANASLPLTLLVAVMWRYRDRAAHRRARARLRRGGEALPLAARRLARARRPALGGRDRRGRRRRVAAPAPPVHEPRATTCGSCGTSARRSSTRRTRRSRCSPTSACRTRPPARSPIALGLGVLALAWRRRSLGLAIAAALVLSPIVWRHFFVLLARAARAVASTIRRRVAHSHRDVGRRRHVQRRAVADGRRASRSPR